MRSAEHAEVIPQTLDSSVPEIHGSILRYRQSWVAIPETGRWELSDSGCGEVLGTTLAVFNAGG